MYFTFVSDQYQNRNQNCIDNLNIYICHRNLLWKETNSVSFFTFGDLFGRVTKNVVKEPTINFSSKESVSENCL